MKTSEWRKKLRKFKTTLTPELFEQFSRQGQMIFDLVDYLCNILPEEERIISILELRSSAIDLISDLKLMAQGSRPKNSVPAGMIGYAVITYVRLEESLDQLLKTITSIDIVSKAKTAQQQ